MDRRERYDPEDIEILMQERSFDELLEEERAYVLRHVSDRAEYEAMRGLLMHMRQDVQDNDPIEADPAIRTNVIQAFRDEQKPQWRIWLNSVGAALFPDEAMAMWRPALALAGLALVIVVSVVLVRQAGSENSELAELRPATTEEGARPTERPEPIAKPEQEVTREAGAEPATLDEALGNTQMEVAEEAEQGVGAARTLAFESEAKEMDDSAVEEASERTLYRDLDIQLDEKAATAPAPSSKETAEGISYSHIVTAEELSQNMSVANATGKVRLRELAAADALTAVPAASASMAENSDLLQLLATGW